MSIPEALLLGVVEGITEYLPVSSTGHLNVVNDLLGLTDTEAGTDAANAYAIVIQLGAILAVLGLYRQRIARTLRAVLVPRSDDDDGRRLALALVAAFVPAGLTAFVFGDLIKDRLFGMWPTLVAWFVGGLVILWWSRKGRSGDRPLDDITLRDGLIIGVVQILALWPGVSRSLVTIIAAMSRRFGAVAAVEISFLLGLITLGIATVYEGWDSGGTIVDEFGLAAPLVGLAAALVSAAVAVRWLVTYLERRGLEVFGWYRIAIAVVGAGLLAAGVI
ncbi:undecaprenyl-diphosphate phosphatase [Actinomarinicola tropica]|uniref:Undecaprenyl-diphosphatase n=1 Tax=Actinomarinicola tropica TaxID=2789776 RepID=A0A5Q2RJK0_9ACTN|nr:undecaprenyl-diphosphate phosphatase [Actinomarinicola tropica]